MIKSFRKVASRRQLSSKNSSNQSWHDLLLPAPRQRLQPIEPVPSHQCENYAAATSFADQCRASYSRRNNDCNKLTATIDTIVLGMRHHGIAKSKHEISVLESWDRHHCLKINATSWVSNFRCGDLCGSLIFCSWGRCHSQRSLRFDRRCLVVLPMGGHRF